MASVLILGVLIGGFVAWHWKLIHVGWEEWRFAVARVKRTRKAFWKRLGRGILVTVGAVILLYVVIR